MITALLSTDRSGFFCTNDHMIFFGNYVVACLCIQRKRKRDRVSAAAYGGGRGVGFNRRLILLV